MNDDPLDPIRRILDKLAAATEPPCDYLTIYEGNQKAIHDISVYVYPEETE